MRLRQLEAFQQVMLTGSLTRAGAVLGVSQPGVSRLLAELERHVGFRLFERRGGRVHPTREAVQFLRHVERSFVGMQALRTAAADIADAKGAELRLAAFPAVSLQLLPQCFAEFSSAYPDTRVSMMVTNSTRVTELVAMLQVDFGISTLPVIHGALATEFEIALPCVCALPPGHSRRQARSIRAADLRGERLIALDPGFATSRGLESILAGARIDPKRVAEVSFSFAACEMVRRGAGVAIVDPMTALAFGERDIVFRPFLPTVEFSVGLVRAAHGPLSLAGQRMAASIVSALKELQQRLDSMLGSTPHRGEARAPARSRAR